jgi:uncharacterized protein involved in type VI secretion and phage assembly
LELRNCWPNACVARKPSAMGYTFTISALSLDAGISLRALLGQPALLELLTVKQRLQTNAVELRSWDYRTLDSRPVSSAGVQPAGAELASRDTPGQYAYPTRAQGQRIADRQMQALDARRQVFIGAGTVRTFAPGTTFALSGHAVHDMADGDDARSFVITRVLHLMHNNLSADLQSNVEKRVGEGTVAAAIAVEQDGSAVPQPYRRNPCQRSLLRQPHRRAGPTAACTSDNLWPAKRGSGGPCRRGDPQRP